LFHFYRSEYQFGRSAQRSSKNEQQIAQLLLGCADRTACPCIRRPAADFRSRKESNFL